MDANAQATLRGMNTVDLASLSLDCPLCGTRLYSIRAGQWCVKTRLLKFDNGKILAKCDHCRHDVPVPWLHVDGARSIDARPTGTTSRVLVARVSG